MRPPDMARQHGDEMAEPWVGALLLVSSGHSSSGQGLTPEKGQILTWGRLQGWVKESRGPFTCCREPPACASPSLQAGSERRAGFLCPLLLCQPRHNGSGRKSCWRHGTASSDSKGEAMIKIPLKILLGFWLGFSSVLPPQGLESKNPAQISVSTLGTGGRRHPESQLCHTGWDWG